MAVVGLLAVALWQWTSALSGTSDFQDTDVYWRAGRDVLAGHDPYATDGTRLPFTYPPFAALAFLPLAALSRTAAQTTVVLLSLGALAAVLAVLARRLGATSRERVLLVAFALACVPVVRTVQQGQVNLVLLALVVLDVTVVPRRWRGILTGVAAGIKIVPAVLVLVWVVSRDWSACARVAVAGAATVLVSALVVPDAARTYWLHLLLDPNRSGGGRYADNQSLTGVVARALQDDTPPGWLTLPLQAMALVLAVLAARRVWSLTGSHLAVAAVIGLGGLLASPVSWSHHWVWVVPAVAVGVRTPRTQAAWPLAVAALVPPLLIAQALPRPWVWWHGIPLLVLPLAAIVLLLRLATSGGPVRARTVVSRTSARGGPRRAPAR